MLDDLLEWDTTTAGISIIMYLIVVFMIWKMGNFMGEMKLMTKWALTIAMLPLTYFAVKFQMNR